MLNFAVGMHVVLALFTALASPPAGRPLALALALCFPVLGPAFGLVVAVLSRRNARHPASGELLVTYRALIDAMPVVTHLPADARGDAVERSWEAMDLGPFTEVLSRHSDGDVIASAFAAVMKLDRPVACRLLRRALSSPVPVTRYYASNALASVEEDLDRELQAAEAARALMPDAMATARLADARFAYSDMGEPTDPVTHFHLLEAIQLYRACLDDLPSGRRDAARVTLARALVMTGKPGEAAAQYRTLVEAGAREVSILVGCVEACHLAHQHAALTRYLAIARERCPGSEVVESAARTFLDVQEVAA